MNIFIGSQGVGATAEPCNEKCRLLHEQVKENDPQSKWKDFPEEWFRIFFYLRRTLSYLTHFSAARGWGSKVNAKREKRQFEARYDNEKRFSAKCDRKNLKLNDWFKN